MRPRFVRPGIGTRLAALFLLLLLIGVSTMRVAEDAFDRHVELAQFVNESGRLRMLTQSIAYGAHLYVEGRPGARRDLVRLLDEFASGLQAVEDKVALLAGTDSLARLESQWRRYEQATRRLVDRDLGGQGLGEILRGIDDEAGSMLKSTEDIVQLALQRHTEERRHLRFKLFGALLLGLAVTVLAYWRIRQRVVDPVRRIAGMTRDFAAGKLDARVDYAANDEIGELVAAVNKTAAATQQLIVRYQETERAIQDSEERNRMLWETSTDGIVMMDADNIVRHANPAVAAIFGYAADELIGRHISILQPERLREAHRKGFERYRRSGVRTLRWQSMEVPALHRDGREIPIELSFSHIRLSNAEWFAAFFRDISLRAEAQNALRIRERAMESTGEGIMISDAVAAGHPALYVNPAFHRITGYAAEEVVGRNGRFLLGDDLGQPAVEALRHLLREKRDGMAVLRCRRKDGTPFWSEVSVSPVRGDGGTVTHTISIFKDVTDRKRQEEELLRSAHHDSLTGLANRTLLHDRLAQAITVAHRHNRQVGVLYIDLDNFKLVNDSLGHGAGDRLLQEAAQRLQTCLREGDTAARLGGDEFVLLLTDMEHENDIAHIAERVLTSLVKPFRHNDRELYVSASVGASVYPRDGTDGQTLLKHADIAMYRAKDHGRNNFQMFTEEMQVRINQRLTLETSLRKALEREEFELFYQPQVDLDAGRIVGAEALLRWRHPELGMVSPAQFIPLAEETGMIVPIGEWVLDAACAQTKAWLRAGLPPLCVAVNLSARQFRQRNLSQIIEQSLRLHELDSLHLELELTESMVMQDPEQTVHILRHLKDIGLRISLDDFGTGYSSLSHLRSFPIDVLKVDQSFIRNVASNPDDAAIAASIIALAHSLQLAVIAEGVETREQLQYLRRHDCDIIQGYYFSRPVPAAEFAALLASGRQLASGDLMPAGSYLM